MITLNIGVKSFYRWEAYNPKTGRTRILSDWSPNVLLDSGRNYMGSNGGWLDYNQVGTSATPTPSAGDAGLDGYFNGTGTIISDVKAAQGSSPWYGRREITYEYDKGTTATPLQETGQGWAVSGSNLVTRALIIDPVTQLPTTVVPLVDEILRVTAQTRYYPPTGDTAGTVTLDGLVYDTITRASEVNVATWQADNIGSEMGVLGSGSNFRAFDDTIGTVDQAPSGVSADLVGTASNTAYVNNSYQRDMVISCGGTGWNLTGGIRSIQITTTAGRFQTRFGRQGGGDEKVPKDATKQMSLTYRLNWIEGTIP